MFILHDTFNDREISRHRKLENAIKAQRKHAAAVRRANGKNSYIPTKITHADGTSVDWDLLTETKIALPH